MILTISRTRGRGMGGRVSFLLFDFFHFSLNPFLFNLLSVIYAIDINCDLSWSAVQDVPGARWRPDGEAEAEEDSHNIHIGSAQGAWEGFPGRFLSKSELLCWRIIYICWCASSSLKSLMFGDFFLLDVISGDSLPRHLHTWGDCHEDRPHWGASSGGEKSF